MNFFYWLTSSFFQVWFILFYRHRVFGVENLPKGPALIACNHVSFFDPPMIAASTKEEIHFLGREGLFKVPLLGMLLRNLNTYPVAHAQHNLESFKLVCHLIKEGKKVTIFPEGERSPDGSLLPMKAGIGMLALRCKCPIVPAFVHGTFGVWPRHRKYPRFFGGRTACVFGKPINVHQYLHLEKKVAQEQIARDVGEAIAELRDWYLNLGK